VTREGDEVYSLSPFTVTLIRHHFPSAVTISRHPFSSRLFITTIRDSPLSVKKENIMPKGYWINSFRAVKDQAKVDAYRKLAGPAMEAAGAKFLVRGDPVKVYEAGLNMRAVVIEFPSVEAAIAAHDSPGYQAALRALGDGAERDLRIVEGTS